MLQARLEELALVSVCIAGVRQGVVPPLARPGETLLSHPDAVLTDLNPSQRSAKGNDVIFRQKMFQCVVMHTADLAVAENHLYPRHLRVLLNRVWSVEDVIVAHLS